MGRNVTSDEVVRELLTDLTWVIEHGGRFELEAAPTGTNNRITWVMEQLGKLRFVKRKECDA